MLTRAARGYPPAPDTPLWRKLINRPISATTITAASSEGLSRARLRGILLSASFRFFETTDFSLPEGTAMASSGRDNESRGRNFVPLLECSKQLTTTGTPKNNGALRGSTADRRVTDLHSRFIVGWALSAVYDRHPNLSALDKAVSAAVRTWASCISPTKAARTPAPAESSRGHSSGCIVFAWRFHESERTHLAGPGGSDTLGGCAVG